jgi:hypothetical protein
MLDFVCDVIGTAAEGTDSISGFTFPSNSLTKGLSFLLQHKSPQVISFALCPVNLRVNTYELLHQPVCRSASCQYRIC